MLLRTVTDKVAQLMENTGFNKITQAFLINLLTFYLHKHTYQTVFLQPPGKTESFTRPLTFPSCISENILASDLNISHHKWNLWADECGKNLYVCCNIEEACYLQRASSDQDNRVVVCDSTCSAPPPYNWKCIGKMPWFREHSFAHSCLLSAETVSGLGCAILSKGHLLMLRMAIYLTNKELHKYAGKWS